MRVDAGDAGISEGVAGRMVNFMRGRLTNAKRPGTRPGRLSRSGRWRSASVTHEAQQEQEQVDEVEVERQRTPHRLAADHRAVVVDIVHLLDALRIPSGEDGG